MSIIIKGNYTAWEREFDRLESMPDYKTQVALFGVLREGFVLSNADTHVDTGSLKASEKAKGDVDKATHTWTGTLTWGGPSTGINNPVDYAIYEKARGGDHDFTHSLDLLHVKWVLAMKGGLGK